MNTPAQCGAIKPPKTDIYSEAPHNIGHWTALLAGAPPATNHSRRTRLVALAAVLVNRSGTPTLRYPARWPWATQFHTTLSALRALPGPSG